MKISKFLKVTGLTLGLLATGIVAPNVLSDEQYKVHAYSVSDISKNSYDNLDRKEFFNDKTEAELRHIILEAGLEEINKTRKAMGLSPVVVGEEAVQQTIYKHLRYVAIEEEYGHYQNKKNSKYFTGYDFETRLKVSGKKDSQMRMNENIIFGDSYETQVIAKYLLQNSKYNEEIFKAFVKDKVRGLIEAPYHGATILAPYTDEVNIAMYLDKNIKHIPIGIITSASEASMGDTEDLKKPRFYPYDGQTDVITHMTKGMEDPDPIAEAGLQVGGKPLIAYSYSKYNDKNRYVGEAIVSKAVLVNAKTGKTIPVKKVKGAVNYGLFVPTQKLEPKTQYKVTYTYLEPNSIYEDGGTEKQHTIYFTTGVETVSKDEVIEHSPTLIEYKGIKYDMLNYTNAGGNTGGGQTTPPPTDTPNVVDSKFIKTTDKAKLATAQNDAKTKFTDFKADQYWADAIVWMYANGIMAGSPTSKKIPGTNQYYNSFMPNNNLTEVQMLAMMFRYTANGQEKNFPASSKDYGVVYYNMAKEIGLKTKGDAGANRAKGNQDITREEMAIIFVETITGQKMSGRQAIQYLYDNEISTGGTETRTVTQIQSNGTVKKVTETYAPKTYDSFKPKDKLTRAHVSAFFYRTQQQVELGKIQIKNSFK